MVDDLGLPVAQLGQHLPTQARGLEGSRARALAPGGAAGVEYWLEGRRLQLPGAPAPAAVPAAAGQGLAAHLGEGGEGAG